MTSFGWKRKSGEKLCKSTSTTFSLEAKDDVDIDDSVVDWLTLAPKKRAISLEDALSKSERLKAEGAVLAEVERFWEAIKKWDEAIQLTPLNEKIVEMKAQVAAEDITVRAQMICLRFLHHSVSALMAVGEVFPAVQVAERVVQMAPTWWVGHQTLGRALSSIGEVRMALKSFSKAVHLNPADEDLWLEDLLWTKTLLERKKLVTATDKESAPKSSVTVTEVKDDHGDESVRESSLVMFSRGLGDSGPDCHVDTNSDSKHIRSLPTNYVHMRDPT